MAAGQIASETAPLSGAPPGVTAGGDYDHARTKPELGRPTPAPDANTLWTNDKIGAALADAEMLLRHLARSGKTMLDPKVYSEIAQARHAWQSQLWTVEVDARFWIAFGKLAEVVKPVTIESLSADASGDAQRMTRNYFRSTLCVGAVIVPISIYGFVNASISEPLDKWIQEQNASEIELQSFALNAQPMRGAAPPVPDAAGATLSRDLFLKKLMDFAAANREIFFRSQALNHNILARAAEPWWTADEKDNRANLQVDPRIAQSLGSGALGSGALASGSDAPGQNLKTIADEGFNKIATYQDIRAFARHVLLINQTFFAAITLFLLPILYALLGALAYALRNLVRDVKDKTYLPSLSNRARLIIAVIAGTVIGLFNNFSRGISVPPLAIAFLVGYSVEVFFSFLDAMIQRIKLSTRKPRPL